MAKTPKGLKGGRDRFLRKVTVSGTHVAMMAATPRLRHHDHRTTPPASREVVDLAECLIKMGDQDLRPGHGADQWIGGRAAACRARATRCCPTASRPAPTPWRSPWPRRRAARRAPARRCSRAPPRRAGAGPAGHRRADRVPACASPANGGGMPAPVDVTTRKPFPPASRPRLRPSFMALMTRAEGLLALPRDDLREPASCTCSELAPPRERQEIFI